MAPGASVEAAIAHAAHDTLAVAFPTFPAATLAAERAAALSAATRWRWGLSPGLLPDTR